MNILVCTRFIRHKTGETTLQCTTHPGMNKHVMYNRAKSQHSHNGILNWKARIDQPFLICLYRLIMLGNPKIMYRGILFLKHSVVYTLHHILTKLVNSEVEFTDFRPENCMQTFHPDCFWSPTRKSSPLHSKKYASLSA